MKPQSSNPAPSPARNRASATSVLPEFVVKGADHMAPFAGHRQGTRRGASLRRILTVLAAGVVVTGGVGAISVSEAANIERSPGGEWAKGQILVSPAAGLSDAEFDNMLGTQGGKRVGKVQGLNIHVVTLPVSVHGQEDAVARALAHNPHIKFAEVDGILTPATTTNDPMLPNEWHISRVGASSAWGVATGTGVVVAVLDTGVQSSHPDLAANIVPGWNTYDNTSNTQDSSGHGTAVAGTIAAVGNNGIGDAGVAYTAKIMPIRITDSTGSNATFSTMANGLTWAADHGAKVANISFSNVYKSSTMQAAAQYMRNKGGETVVAANNNGINENSAQTDMIVVSATDQNNNRASFSSYGNMVDLAAPGVTIYTTLWNSGYGYGTGTSFATPVVAGTVALMLSTNPALAPSQIESLLYSTAVNLGASGYDIYYGYGMVNAAGAVQAARNGVAPADTTPPTASITSPGAGATVAGLVPVSVGASDNVGVTKVELYAGTALVGTDTTAPYSFSWDTTKVANAVYGLLAKAYDAAGNEGTSTTVNVAVSNTVTPPPVVPLTVAITNPKNGTKVRGNVTIQAAASDSVAISKLSLSIDGIVKATGNLTSLSYSWNANKVSAGNHTIQAVATDVAGSTKSAAVTVTK
jgi:hypothetical protein